MNARERFHAVLDGKPFDRLPLLEWAHWWDKTIDRWHGEGLPASLTDRYAICEHFGLDLYLQDWIASWPPRSPIASMQEYEDVVRDMYPRDRVDRRRWSEWAARSERGEAVLWFTLHGFFWHPRVLLGIEQHLYAFYDQPELMHRINADLLAWNLHVIDQICSVARPDFMTFAEDMSYNHGPMLSEEQFDEFLAPYYRAIVPELHRRNIRVFVDSDGDVTRAAGWFERVGVDGILPLERQSGVDVAALRRAHPSMKWIGHFDKLTMHRGEPAMRAGFDRLLPLAGEGGLLVSCDHQTPPEVSLQDYQLYLRLFREYADRAGRMSRERNAHAVTSRT